MHIGQSTWSYALSLKAEARVPALTSGVPFAHIGSRVAKELNVLCCHASRVLGTEFARPVFTIGVGNELFDLFFNSQNGYRGSYFRSPGAGMDVNLSFMRAIAPRLTEDPLSVKSALSRDYIRESLTTPSAKAWLAEHGKEIDQKCPACKGEWSSGSAGLASLAEIRNAKWEIASGQKAEWGRKAPYLSKLRVMGAFINDQHSEYVPHDKRFRANEIHEFGWS